MRDGFIQRGGLWVLAQSALLVTVFGLGITFRNNSKHIVLLLGGLVFLLASAYCGILRQSWPALAVSLVLAAFFDAKARHEESCLREQFPEYAEYQRRVRRFLPWIF